MTARYLWAIALGLGIGLVGGAILAIGLQFERSDVARFIGALIGSLIAVSGAVSLYYLKEFNDRSEKISDFRDLLEGMRVFCVLCADEFRNESDEDNLPSALKTMDAMWKRVMRFGLNHEFDAYSIGHAYHMLIVADGDFSELASNSNYSEKDYKYVCKMMDIRVDVIGKAIEELNVKNPRKSK